MQINDRKLRKIIREELKGSNVEERVDSLISDIESVKGRIREVVRDLREELKDAKSKDTFHGRKRVRILRQKYSKLSRYANRLGIVI